MSYDLTTTWLRETSSLRNINLIPNLTLNLTLDILNIFARLILRSKTKLENSTHKLHIIHLVYNIINFNV